MSLDHETEDSVTVMVTVTDSGGLSAEAETTVAVTAAADDGAIDENAMGAVVGAVTGSDVDDGDTLTYTVDDERFEVAGGMLQLKEGMSLDHETEDSVTVMVTVTDSGGLTAEASATVTVNDVTTSTKPRRFRLRTGLRRTAWLQRRPLMKMPRACPWARSWPATRTDLHGGRRAF
jgi:hypothetical protein